MTSPEADTGSPRHGPLRMLRTTVNRWAASEQEVDAENLRHDSIGAGCTALRDCRVGSRVRVQGNVTSVLLQPRSETPALEAELYDGTGTVALVWLGRRRIGGIEPGVRLTAEGRYAARDGRPVIHNPRYTLHPGEA